jgi:type IV pilus assembly protein PilM
MLKSKSFLSIDFGAGTLKVAEFEPNEEGSLVLRQYGLKPLGLAGSQESAREAALRKAIQELLNERGFTSKNINVCAPGLHVFSKFVKLPPVDTSKVTQIIQYEAQQNVPFPLEEVVWDYQILGSSAGGELEVLLVAIKAELVEGLFRTAEASGLRLNLVDVSPAALCNAFRYNYGDLEGCTMLLDIGAKTSNLLFFEKGKVYSRGINIGANSITQEFAAEAKLRFPDAEQLKINEGFVSLGGAYEEPENPHQAAISKIARQVMTRLHIQVNQTIQFYRGQQGGSAPQRLFLAGGASIMPYTAQFFAEKLNVPVEYFNPFRNVQIDPSIDLEQLASVAHSFGEVVGLGLRNVAQCPVELNLVPKSIRKRQMFEQKKPYFIAAIFSLVLAVFAYGWFYDRIAAVKAASLQEIGQEVAPLKRYEDQLVRHENAIKRSQAEIEAYTEWTRQRMFWGDLLTELRLILMRTEQAVGQGGMEAGVWIHALATEPLGSRTGMDFGTGAEEESSPYAMDPQMAARYGLVDPRMAGRYGLPGGDPDDPYYGLDDPYGDDPFGDAGVTEDTNEVSVLYVKFRAVNRRTPDRNSDLAFRVLENLLSSAILDPDGTKLSDVDHQITETALTFDFNAELKLKEPIKR